MKKFAALALLLLTTACVKPRKTVIPAFYHWKSYISWHSDGQDGMAAEIGIQRLYVKWMDIDWTTLQGAVPIQVTNGYLSDTVRDIVPVVYITNSVFKNCTQEELQILADRIIQKLSQPTQKFRLFYRQEIRELQVDVDWTATTRDAYFYFLEYLKKQMGNIRLSVTIRLYQYKYRKESGVPPADRGMVMLYNMSNPREFSEVNSIMDIETAKKYLIRKKYPLPVDLALPFFQWGIAYRDDKFLVLINDLGEREADQMGFLRKNNWYYDVVADTVYQGNFLRKGDKIKIENTSWEKLEELADLGKRIINSDTTYISVFDWDTSRIHQAGYENIKHLYDRF